MTTSRKHCAECKYANINYSDGHQCYLLNVPLEEMDVNENEHCWLEDQYNVKELFPEMIEEAISACPHYSIQYGREEWMNDNELYFALVNHQVGSTRSDLILRWLKEEQSTPSFM